jgi:hypothetical protein
MNDGPRGSNRKQRFVKAGLNMPDPLKPLFSTPMAGLERLAKRAKAAATLTSLVVAELPESVRPHVVSASRRDDDLVVIVDSAAWTARVRYAGPRLKERLRALGEPVEGRVRVRVRGR